MKKILVVEDVAFNRDLLVQLLEDRYCVITAEDGERGIEAARRDRPDLILMDLSLPAMDGWEAARRLKEDEQMRDVPIIAVTAHAMRGDRERALAAGCEDYITKPIDEDVLFAKIDRYLGQTATAGGDGSSKP